ncbi:hypothetical protein [Knoellia koreensis]|uniref:Uncharacterized protein n=1 Tax=Knoellia koreensis TaxID=2730921 RepID=A0A849HGA2_9MICO|nr:hypothetical protein [Knoellia sp. DB2414S]NNM46448.1 hypothetical protein [Knoellia sp. DB2414S]
MLLIEEPAVTNLGSLPAGEEPTAVKPLIAPADGPGRRVTGGGSFSDAITLTPGTYSDVILPDEQIFYRVRGDFGQRLGFTVDAPTPGETIKLGSTSYTSFNVGVWNPWRYPLTRAAGQDPDNGDSIGPSGEPLVLGEFTPTIQYRNREVFGNGRYSYVPLREASVAGYYYFAIGRSQEDAGDDEAAPVTVRIRVAVEGQPTGQPQYAGGAPAVVTGTSSPSETATGSVTTSPSGKDANAKAVSQETRSEGGLPVWVWIVGSVVVLAAAGGVALGAMRRGSTTGGHQ